MPGILVVNYKAYESAFDYRALNIAERAAKIWSILGVRVILAVPAVMVHRVMQYHDDVYLQHVDPIPYGAYTGYTPPEALIRVGVKGSLVNHSEHKMVYRDVATAVELLRQSGLESLVCADTPGEAQGLAHLKPSMIAVEPPELIGTGTPVSRARPEVITDSIKAVMAVDPGLPVLAGAGITAADDVARAVELGARGVLVASAVMKDPDPPRKLEELAQPLASL